MKIRDFVSKRCFYTTEDGERRCIVHRSVVLGNGATVRYNRKGGLWKIEWPPRLDTAVATSLSRYAMYAAVEAGKLKSEVTTYVSFEAFSKELERLVGADAAFAAVTFLNGGK